VTDILIAFNAGSSSLKIGMFELDHGSATRAGRATVDFDQDVPTLSLSIGDRSVNSELSGYGDEDFADLVGETIEHILGHLPGDLKVVAHRIVHGGMSFAGPVVLDDRAIDEIDKLTPLAPLHQPKALRVVRAVRSLRPALLQTGSFDTAFHATQGDVVRRLAIPRAMHDHGVRRYGFHGLSYKFIASKLARLAPDAASRRVVVAHLGSGASLCGLRDGGSVDTSMGFSALDGVPMATRPGALDAGVILYLMRQGMRQPERIEDFLYHECGLLGVSGISGDTRVLLKESHEGARQAIDMFCFRIAGEVARLATSLGGLDAIVFTAGVGENQPEVRSRVVERLGWMDVELDRTANETNATVISAKSSAVRVLVIPTDEEQVIADEAIGLLNEGAER